MPNQVTLPPVDELVADVANVEKEAPPQDFSAPSAPLPTPKVDLDAIVAASPSLSLGKKIEDSPELLFGPVAAALSSQPGMNAEGIKSRLLDTYRVVLEACDWVRTGKAKRRFAIEAYVKGLRARSSRLDRESADKADEGRKIRGSVNGMIAEDPMRLARLKKADETLREAVRLRDESRSIDAQIAAVAKAQAEELSAPSKSE